MSSVFTSRQAVLFCGRVGLRDCTRSLFCALLQYSTVFIDSSLAPNAQMLGKIS
jgi:hypothetical protein